MPTTLEQSQYGFDRDSRRTWQRRSLTDTQDQHYNYDALSQVSAAARGSLNLNKTAISSRPVSAQSWDYDPTGNWRGYHTAANGTPTLDQHRVHDRGNRLTQIEDNPNNMILDRVGRMRQMSPDAQGDWEGKLEITWDAWSRITKVRNNGEVVGEYTYDGSHRRVKREVEEETLHSYYNDAWRPVEERKNSETTANISYLWGSRHRDDLVRRDRAVGGTTLNETRYVLMDYFNPAAVTDAIGVVKERYAFSAFGVRTILNPDFTVRSNSECEMEFAFQGQFLDAESGLLNYGYRYYSPQLGRWTCKDPIEEDGGWNLFSITDNHPINELDYLGLAGREIRILETKTMKDNVPGFSIPIQHLIPFGEDTIQLTSNFMAVWYNDGRYVENTVAVMDRWTWGMVQGRTKDGRGDLRDTWTDKLNDKDFCKLVFRVLGRVVSGNVKFANVIAKKYPSQYHDSKMELTMSQTLVGPPDSVNVQETKDYRTLADQLNVLPNGISFMLIVTWELKDGKPFEYFSRTASLQI